MGCVDGMFCACIRAVVVVGLNVVRLLLVWCGLVVVLCGVVVCLVRWVAACGWVFVWLGFWCIHVFVVGFGIVVVW